MNIEPAPPLEVSFTSGGQTCRAWHFPPESKALESYGRAPIIVMGHGFGGTRDAGLVPYARRFAAAGLHAVVFDYRHFGASDGEPRQLISIERQLEDWAAAASFARAIAGADPARVAVWGASLSGGHVIMLAGSDRRVAAAIALCPLLDGMSMLRSHLQDAGIRSGFGLLWAGTIDRIGAWLRRAPKMLPVTGPPGSSALMPRAHIEAGYRAIAPQDWHNEAAARIVLELPFYRPMEALPSITCPLLIQQCGNDQAPPPFAPASIRAAAKRTRCEIITYDCGYFDTYHGEWFEKSVSGQLSFLETAFAPR